MSQIPAIVHPHLDVIQHSSGGGLYLGASSLTGRNWTGSLWYFRDAQAAPDWERCTAGVELESGVTDLRCLNDKTLLVALDSGTVAWWDLKEEEHTFGLKSQTTDHDDIVSSLDTNSTKTKAVSGSHDKRVIVWDLDESVLLHSYRGHAGVIHCVACHPEEPNTFLSCAADGVVLMWDLRNSKPARTLGSGVDCNISRVICVGRGQVDRKDYGPSFTYQDISSLGSAPTSVAWQPGKETSFVVGSETGCLCLLDQRSSKPLCLTPHSRSVRRLVFNPQSPSVLASLSEDCTVAISQFTTDGASVIRLDSRHNDFSTGASWSPTTGKLVTCGWDFQVLEHGMDSNGEATVNGKD